MIARPLSRRANLRGSFYAAILIINAITKNQSDWLQMRRKASRGAGGCKFFADPGLPHELNPVFWRPEDCASVIMLSRTTSGKADSTIKWSDLPIIDSRSDAMGRRHLLLKHSEGYTQVVVENTDDAGLYLKAIVVLDSLAERRLAATTDLLRLIGKKSAITRPGSSQMIERLRRALITLDACEAGATHREIAIHFFGKNRIADEIWKISSIRQTIIRLNRTGNEMMKGGYTKLLQL